MWPWKKREVEPKTERDFPVNEIHDDKGNVYVAVSEGWSSDRGPWCKFHCKDSQGHVRYAIQLVKGAWGYTFDSHENPTGYYIEQDVLKRLAVLSG